MVAEESRIEWFLRRNERGHGQSHSGQLIIGRVSSTVVVMILLCAPGVRGAPPQGQVRELLRRSLAHQQTMRRVRLEAKEEYWVQNVGKPRTTEVLTARYTRFDAWAELTAELRAEIGHANPVHWFAREVTTPVLYVSIPGAPGGTPSSVVCAGPETVKRYRALSQKSAHGGYLDGCSALIELGPRLWTEPLRFRELPSEQVRGTECKVVEGETPYGNFRVWIAPARGFHQIRWRLVQLPHHYYDTTSDELLAELVWHTEQGPMQVESWITEVDVTAFTRVGGKLIPSAGRQRSLICGKDGVILQQGAGVIRRHNIRPVANRAEVADAFLVNLPDGTPVNNLDDPSGVQYVWRGGRVVRGHTEFSGAAQGRWQPRPIWVYVGWIVLALATAGIALRVWYARRSRLQQEQP